MLSYKNKDLNIQDNPSVIDSRNFKLEGGIDQLTLNIQETIVGIDNELEELRQVSYFKPQERRKIARIQDIFFLLFHQFAGLDDIKRYATHQLGERTPLNSECF